MTTHDCTYQANLAALTERQPEVATAIDEAPVPFGVEAVQGRDGSETFLLTSDDSRREWFGWSSMPKISAWEILSQFRSDGQSLSLPGVLTGLEPLLLARALPPHSYVLVVEDQLWRIKLAMRLHGYEAMIGAGRLVFAGEGRLAEHLTALFDAHPGYDFPAHVVTIPHLTPAESTTRRRRLEEAAEIAGRRITERMTVCARELADRPRATLPDMPGVAFVGTDAAPLTLEQGRRIARSMGRVGGRFETCLPDAPNKCHILARLETVARVDADIVVLVNSCAGHLRSYLPPDRTIVSWYLPGANVSATMHRSHPPDYPVFACSRGMQRDVLACGVPDDLVELCEPGADPVQVRGRGPEGEAMLDVAMLIDLPDDRPEVAQVTLDTHLKLWRATQDVLARDPDRCGSVDPRAILRDAERLCGMSESDDHVSERFVRFIRVLISPPIAASAQVAALHDGGVTVGVWGGNWSGRCPEPATHQGDYPVGDALGGVLARTRAIVLPDASPWAVQTALDALAAGVAAIFGVSHDSFVDEYPGLTDVAEHIRFYRTRAELVATVNEMRSESPASAARVEAAREVVLSGHTVAHRYRSILRRLRERAAI